jgi:hypothetical protein
MPNLSAMFKWIWDHSQSCGNEERITKVMHRAAGQMLAGSCLPQFLLQNILQTAKLLRGYLPYTAIAKALKPICFCDITKKIKIKMSISYHSECMAVQYTMQPSRYRKRISRGIKMMAGYYRSKTGQVAN